VADVATDRLSPIVVEAVNKLMSVAAASGYFDSVQSYEPKSNPGPGLTFATWVNQIRPIALQSGLAVTSARVPMTCRAYLPMLADPQGGIDTRLAVASNCLLAELTGAFTLTGGYIDLLGAYGDGLGTDLGYVELDDAMFRIADTLVPFICPDVFDQGE
jgi:hypothetical protein